jgi:hypothetical protein
MRKFFFFAILAIGAGIGLLFTVATNGDWGLGLVALGAGLLFRNTNRQCFDGHWTEAQKISAAVAQSRDARCARISLQGGCSNSTLGSIAAISSI